MSIIWLLAFPPAMFLLAIGLARLEERVVRPGQTAALITRLLEKTSADDVETGARTLLAPFAPSRPALPNRSTGEHP